MVEAADRIACRTSQPNSAADEQSRLAAKAVSYTPPESSSRDFGAQLHEGQEEQSGQ